MSRSSCLVLPGQGRGKPYTVVFVGVNGVGKSTNLAKARRGGTAVSGRPSHAAAACGRRRGSAV